MDRTNTKLNINELITAEKVGMFRMNPPLPPSFSRICIFQRGGRKGEAGAGRITKE